MEVGGAKRSLESPEKYHDSGAAHPRPKLSTAYVVPRDEMEQCIVEAWQAILGIEQIGVNDNFFDLGGDSLLATQVRSRLREIVNVELSVAAIFDAPTPAEFSRHAARISSQDERSEKLKHLRDRVKQMTQEEKKALLHEARQARNSK